MATSFYKKRRLKYWIISFVVLLFLLLLGLIIGNKTTYPFEKAGRWVSTDPYFVLDFLNSNGDIVEQNGFLEIDGTLQQVHVGLRASQFTVMSFDPNTSFYNYEDRLLEGKWKYRWGKLVFYNFDDFAFDGMYSEIVFTPEEQAD